MRKWLLACMLVVLAPLLISCSSAKANSKDVKAADELALKYIQAYVEGDDALYKQILSKTDARLSIVEDGYHANPGLFKEMGGRYSIYRFEKSPAKDGTLHYRVLMYHTKNKEDYSEFLKIAKEEGEWKVLTVSKQEAGRQVADPNNGVTVHKYKE